MRMRDVYKKHDFLLDAITPSQFGSSVPTHTLHPTDSSVQLYFNMLQDHSKMSIALILLYIPVVLLSTYLACHKHKRPRMAWITLMFFSTSKYSPARLILRPLI